MIQKVIAEVVVIINKNWYRNAIMTYIKIVWCILPLG